MSKKKKKSIISLLKRTKATSFSWKSLMSFKYDGEGGNGILVKENLFRAQHGFRDFIYSDIFYNLTAAFIIKNI